MSTCHQAHNIPWDELTEVLHKMAAPSMTERQFGFQAIDHKLAFTADEEGKVPRKIRFFANKLHSTIKEFSKTERKKYVDEDIDKMSKLFDDDSCNEYLRKGLQELREWKPEEVEDEKRYYNYTEAFKELFIQEKVCTLLHLARSGIKMENYQFVTHSNFFHYGVGRIKEDCLTLYIHLNILLATGKICKPDEWYIQWKRFRNDEVINRYDGNSHARMYKDYFEKNPNFEDLNGLGTLLKKLFRMLYFYDMVMAERNINISWEDEVLRCVGSYFLDHTNPSYSAWRKHIYNE